MLCNILPYSDDRGVIWSQGKQVIFLYSVNEIQMCTLVRNLNVFYISSSIVMRECCTFTKDLACMHSKTV